MGKAKKRKSRSSERPRTVAPGDQFGHGLPGRRRALMALDNLKPAQMPLLLDAFDNTATPALRHLEPYALAVPELDTFRRTRRIGPTLARWSQLLGVSADTLLVNQEHYFCLGSSERTVGAVDEQVLTAMYCAYRCSSGATIDRHAYYASEEITALILAGSESSAVVGVTAADLPSPTGVAYLSQSAGALLLLWQVLDDDLLSVQLVPAEGARSFISNDGAPKTGWGYRFINHMYLPIPTAEALLSPVESDAPPSLQASGGFHPEDARGCATRRAGHLSGVVDRADPRGVHLLHPHAAAGLHRPGCRRPPVTDVRDLPDPAEGDCHLSDPPGLDVPERRVREVLADLLDTLGGARALAPALVSRRAASSSEVDLDVHRGTRGCTDHTVGQGDSALTCAYDMACRTPASRRRRGILGHPG